MPNQELKALGSRVRTGPNQAEALRGQEDDRAVMDTKCGEHEHQNPQQRRTRVTQPHVERMARHAQGGAGPGCTGGLTGENQPGNTTY